MAKKKLSRKELLSTRDEFLTLSEKAANFCRTHAKQVKITLTVLGALAIIYLGGTLFLGSVNARGQSAYNQAFDILVNNDRIYEDPKSLKEAEKLFQKVVDNYGLSQAATLALPQVGYVNYLANQGDLALGYYQAFRSKMAEREPYVSLSNLALAALYETKGDFGQAIDLLQLFQTRPDNPFREFALLRLERLYRLDHQDEKASSVREEFLKTYPKSPFLPMVKARL